MGVPILIPQLMSERVQHRDRGAIFAHTSGNTAGRELQSDPADTQLPDRASILHNEYPDATPDAAAQFRTASRDAGHHGTVLCVQRHCLLTRLALSEVCRQMH